jgi:UTP--glucose-1-phosphate uridylyltransferase
MATIRTAVITAAGLGTRFLPISKAVPKEMLPLVDRPVIQYAVEQARDAGIERIIIVTSRGKEMTEDYFDLAPDLERTLKARDSPRLDEVRRVSRMADVIAVRQREALGLGHAVLMARTVVGDEPFVVYLPDEVIIGEPSATRQLLSVFEERGGSVVGVIEAPQDQVSRFGIVAGDAVSERELRVSHVVEKPSVEEAPSTLAITGPYVFTPAIFKALEAITAGSGGELQLTDAIGVLAKREPVFAYRYEGKRYDCGTPMGLLKASVELALQRDEYADDLSHWLAELAPEAE